MTERDTAFGRVNIPDQMFSPEVWQSLITAQLGSMSQFRRMLDDNRRRGHSEPPTAAKVEEFEKWKRVYERACEDGYATGWLIQGYEPDEIRDPRGEWVWDETEAEYQARTAAEQPADVNGTVTIPTMPKNEPRSDQSGVSRACGGDT